MNVNNSFVDSVDEYIIKKVEKEKKKKIVLKFKENYFKFLQINFVQVMNLK